MTDGGTSWRRTVEPTETGLRWLRSELGLDQDVHVVSRCGGGIGASTHRLQSGDLHFIVKQYPADKAKAVEREWNGLLVASEHGIPVPAPLAVDATGSDAGLPTIAMTLVPGEPDLRAHHLESFATEVADLMAKIHRIDIDAPSTRTRIAEPPQHWEPPREIPDGLVPPDLIREVVTRILELTDGAEPEEAVLNHGDLHPGNLLWTGPALSALLDWSHIRVGTRATELAYFRIELAVLAGFPAAEMLTERYEVHADVSHEHQLLRDLRHVYAGHCWAHTWLEGWHEQHRSDLTLTDVSDRLTDTARTLLAQ